MMSGRPSSGDIHKQIPIDYRHGSGLHSSCVRTHAQKHSSSLIPIDKSIPIVTEGGNTSGEAISSTLVFLPSQNSKLWSPTPPTATFDLCLLYSLWSTTVCCCTPACYISGSLLHWTLRYSHRSTCSNAEANVDFVWPFSIIQTRH